MPNLHVSSITVSFFGPKSKPIVKAHFAGLKSAFFNLRWSRSLAAKSVRPARHPPPPPKKKKKSVETSNDGRFKPGQQCSYCDYLSDRAFLQIPVALINFHYDSNIFRFELHVRFRSWNLFI